MYFNNFSVPKCCTLRLSQSLCILISAKGVERWVTLQNKDKNPSDLSDVEKSVSTLLSVLFLRLDKMEKELVHCCAL